MEGTTRKRRAGTIDIDTHPGRPLVDPLTSLPATAQAILRAARDLLAHRGYRAVTYQNVARAAGVDKGTISYNFGNKAGLLAAVADSLIHDECVTLLNEVRSLTGEDRIRHTVEGLQRITLAADAQRGWFEMLPYAMRESDLKARMQAQYAWWFEMNLQWLGLDPVTLRDDPRAAGLAALIAAVTDGLAIQVGLGIRRDLTEPMQAFEIMLRSILAELERDGATLA